MHNLVAHLQAIEIYTGKQLGLFHDGDIGPDHDHVHLGDGLLEQLQATDHRSLLS